MGIISKIFNLITVLRIYYQFGFYACLMYYLRRTEVEPHKAWSSRTYTHLKVHKHQLPGSKPIAPGKMIFLINHRSQADFFLHNVILDHQASFLSRLAVLILIPFFLSATSSLWFFNRSKTIDPQKFNEWLDKKFENSPRPALVAYPEGHRMQGTVKVDKSKLKTGLIRYSYRRKIKVQILMTFGNQNIFNQKILHVGWNQPAYYKFAEVIDPSTFQTENEFVQIVKDRFCQFFDEVYRHYQEVCLNVDYGSMSDIFQRKKNR